MWWNLECIAQQIYVQGDTTWSQALRQAQAVKDRRESEWDHEEWPDSAPKEPPAPPVVPARSARHRFLLEERRRAEPGEPEPEEGKGSDHDKDAETAKKKRSARRIGGPRMHPARWIARAAADDHQAPTHLMEGATRLSVVAGTSLTWSGSR